MSTYTFTTITTGRINIDAGAFNAAPDSSQVVPTWDKANRVSLGFLGIRLNIDATKDTLVIDGVSHAANFYTGATLYSTLVTLFPKANGGSGGSATTVLTLTPVSSTQINAAWTAVSGATGYTLERATTSNFGSVTTAYTGTALSFNDTGLTAGTQYYYRVKVSLVTNSAARNATPVIVVATNNAFTFTFPFNLS